MLLVFDTFEYGRIEIDTQTKEVYLAKDDYITTLAADDSFSTLYGNRVEMHRPAFYDKSPNAKYTLTAEFPRQIGRTQPQPETDAA